MSKIYEALRKLNSEQQSQSEVKGDPADLEFLQNVVPDSIDPIDAPSVEVNVTAESRLVSWADPQSLGAEKFRALATRLENLRNRQTLKSLQVTSGAAHEGKTLVSTNLAFAFAQNSPSKVLLIEGDLHTAALAPLLGLSGLQGISQWWPGRDPELSTVIHRVGDLPLWFLPAGSPFEQPSKILQSKRFVEALLRLFGAFDWVIVDSPPLLPFVDANLWSRLLDGIVLVVREGVASVKTLKKGIQAIDNPNLLGVVFNDASEIDEASYKNHYYYSAKKSSQTIPS